jgi:DNA (cytosine-5)-methyltransferase 1
VLSLFSGCLGLDLGLEAAGFRAVAYVEKDRDCQRVIAARRPHIPIVADVRDVDALKHFAGVECLAGGFPCQDLSYAGKGAGLDGERSGLWFDMADAVRLLRPRHVLVENVPALATRGLGRVLYDLAEAGYVGSWLSVRAADVGAPHGRERIFVLARLADADEQGSQGPEPEGRRLVSAGRGGEAAANSGRERFHGRGGYDPREAARAWAHGRSFASRSAEAADSGGNGFVLRSEPDERPPGGLEASRRGDADGRGLVGAGSDDGHEGEAAADADNATVDGERPRAEPRSGGAAWGEYEPAIRRWESAFDRAAPRPTDDRGRLSARFVEWMLGFPAGWVEVDGVSRSAQLRMLGNAVQVQVATRVGLLLDGRGDIGEEAAA